MLVTPTLLNISLSIVSATSIAKKLTNLECLKIGFSSCYLGFTDSTLSSLSSCLVDESVMLEASLLSY